MVAKFIIPSLFAAYGSTALNVFFAFLCAIIQSANYDYISKTFLGGPQRVIVERIGAEDTYDDALARLKNKKWNYLAIRQQYSAVV